MTQWHALSPTCLASGEACGPDSRSGILAWRL